MKVLFLDIDGVLNSDSWYHYVKAVSSTNNTYKICDIDETDPDIIYMQRQLDDRSCMCLLDIIKNTDCKVVLSSSWKSHIPNENKRLAREISKKMGNIAFDFLDITPITLHRHRGNEICEWLHNSSAKYDIERFCILDDDDFDIQPELNDNFVHVDRNFGLTYIDVNKAIDILNR